MGTDDSDPKTVVLAPKLPPLGPIALPFPVERIDAARFAARYVPQATLAQGGMGLVRLYTDRTLGRTVALKSIRADLSDKSRIQQRFVQEARVQGQLVHPAVPPVYDLGIDPDGQLFFTMKHVQGVTLADVLRGLEAGTPGFAEKYTRRRLLNAFSSLCMAIDFAHQRGVIHRDLKPSNVMLGEFGETYVLDWGIAKVEGDPTPGSADDVSPRIAAETAVGAVLGTPGYIAPELVAGGPQSASTRSDVHALGSILFEILALEPMADAASSRDAATRAPSARAPDAGIPPELDAICQRATDPDPVLRYASAHEVGVALDRYLDGERDEDMRRRLADDHAQRAITLAAEPTVGGLETRREAFREVGRALALAPDHEQAATTMVRLMNEPPREAPREVGLELDRAAIAHRRAGARVAMWTYLAVFLYLPVVIWAGIRDGVAVATVFAAFGASSAISGWTARSGRRSHELIALIVTNFAFASTSVMFGSLVMAPAGIAINTVAFAVIVDRARRPVAIAIGCLAIIVPFILESTGVLAPSYAFPHGTMTILPRAMALSETPTIAILLIVGLVTLVMSSLSVGRLRDDLAELERRLYLYNWNLRQFAPGSAQPAPHE